MTKIRTFTKIVFLLCLSLLFGNYQVGAVSKNNSGKVSQSRKVSSGKDFRIDSSGVLMSYSGTAENVVVPNGVKSISFGAFMDHPEIKSISLPNGLLTIDECAFYGCTSLKMIDLPESVVRIDRLAFGSCTSLEKIYMGKNVKDIAELFVCDCPKLCKFEVNESNENFKVVDGILYSKDMTKLILCPQNTPEIISIPDEVLTIKEQSFFECNNLKQVNIGKNVKYIDEAAFYGCKNLKTVNIGDSVKKIRSYAFAECSSLEEFCVGKNVTYIGNGAFYNCNNLNKFTCLNKKIEFGADVFTQGLGLTFCVSDNSDACEYAVSNKFNFEIV